MATTADVPTPEDALPEPGAWRRELADAVREPDELIDLLGLPEDLRAPARDAALSFPLVVPRGFIARMRRGDPGDPLLRQVLPLDAEREDVPGFDTDPVGELEASGEPGMIRKYAGRVLLVVSGACAIHCRYCFRRHYPYETAPRGLAAWEPALSEIERDATIGEVILSGGDPLLLSDAFLERLAHRLERIPHLRRLRLHTRVPVVIPARVDASLLGWLRKTRLSPWIVVHANHPAELDETCGRSLRRLVGAGVPVLNQAVLLRGVNDDPEVLRALSERLADLGVSPYYLHQLDPVAGASHFAVAEERGRELVEELRRTLPGYAVPRYVKEVAGEPYKREMG